MNISILHVEDEPTISFMVQLAFKRFGFTGNIETAASIEKARDLLEERARGRQPFDLILVDMNLPDGLGIEVVREVRSHPFWHHTPVLMLSGVLEPDVVSEAYALGANCYIPKGGNDVLKDLQALYRCWMETALLPSPAIAMERGRETVARAINLRARTSAVYNRMADLAAANPEEAIFWLERSLVEANLSNLLALFRHKITEEDLSTGLTDRLVSMQTQLEQVLKEVESRLQELKSPDNRLFSLCALKLAEVLDEDIVAEIFGCLFPKNPAATMALKKRAAEHFHELAVHVLEAGDAELRPEAEELRERASRMAAVLPG